MLPYLGDSMLCPQISVKIRDQVAFSRSPPGSTYILQTIPACAECQMLGAIWRAVEASGMRDEGLTILPCTLVSPESSET